MNELHLLALQSWSNSSNEGLLIIDPVGSICLLNPRLQELLKLHTVPQTADGLLRQVGGMMPELRALLETTERAHYTEWGNLRIQQYPAQRVVWQLVPLVDGDDVAGSLIIFRDASPPGQIELAKQSFLSMISHDFRTPLSTILGFAELLYNHQGNLSQEEQAEFLQHIINNANDLSQYTQIALDIMYLEADLQNFEIESVFLNRLVKHWLSDALHRFPSDQIVYHNGAAEEPLTDVAPAALHRILYILVEFALAESPEDNPIDIRLEYDEEYAHVYIEHHAPHLSGEDAALLFRLMNPRDLSEASRPLLHRMQLYVASLLAERQRGFLTLINPHSEQYLLDLIMPLSAVSH